MDLCDNWKSCAARTFTTGTVRS